MRLRMGFVCVLALFISASACGSEQQTSFDGVWVGGYQFGSSYTPARLRITGEATALDINTRGRRIQSDTPIQNVRRSAGRLQFDMPLGEAVVRFDGRRVKNVITGTIARGAEKGAFHLMRLPAVRDELYAEYVGSYRLPNGHVILINNSAPGFHPDQNGRFVPVRDIPPFGGIDFLVWPTTRFGALFPTSDRTFVGGPAALVPHPAEIHAEFSRDSSGRVTTLKWQNQIAKRFEFFTTRDMKFSNGDLGLEGTLYLPLGKGPHPGVVLVLGSDGDTRLRGAWPQLYALNGFAVFTYDRRADWRSVTFVELAADMEAAVRAVRQQPEIDPKKIGIWGISQGGWIAPIVASHIPDLAFVVLHAGAPVTPRRQSHMELENNYSAYGISKSDVPQAHVYLALQHDARVSDEAWEKLQKMYEEANGAPWAFRLRPKEEMRADWFGRVMDFDPRPYLASLKMPILAFFGDRDVLVPSEENARVLEETLKRAGHRHYTIKILPGANHLLQVAFTPQGDPLRIKEFAPGYFGPMFEWMRSVVRAK